MVVPPDSLGFETVPSYHKGRPFHYAVMRHLRVPRYRCPSATSFEPKCSTKRAAILLTHWISYSGSRPSARSTSCAKSSAVRLFRRAMRVASTGGMQNPQSTQRSYSRHVISRSSRGKFLSNRKPKGTSPNVTPTMTARIDAGAPATVPHNALR